MYTRSCNGKQYGKSRIRGDFRECLQIPQTFEEKAEVEAQVDCTGPVSGYHCCRVDSAELPWFGSKLGEV
jgi:hypothetical protein